MKKRFSLILVLVLGLFFVSGCNKKQVNNDLIKQYVEVNNKMVQHGNIAFNLEGDLKQGSQKLSLSGKGNILTKEVLGHFKMDFKLPTTDAKTSSPSSLGMDIYIDKDNSYIGMDMGQGYKWNKQSNNELKGAFGTNTKQTTEKEAIDTFSKMNAEYTKDSIILNLDKDTIKNFGIPTSLLPKEALDGFKIKIVIKVNSDSLEYSVNFDVKAGKDNISGAMTFTMKSSDVKVSIPEDVKEKATTTTPSYSFTGV
jgi:hypothetical protein